MGEDVRTEELWNEKMERGVNKRMVKEGEVRCENGEGRRNINK